MARLRHIFFDLDRTLWDFERNSEEVLRDLYQRYELEGQGVRSFKEFLRAYRRINASFWQAHREGRVEKEELRYDRFHQTLLHHGVSDRSLSQALADQYLLETPTKTGLIEGSVELLEALSPNFHLHLLTNGYADTQLRKVEGTALEAFFVEIVTSDRAGARKPDPKIFEFALEKAGAEKEEALMVGDDPEADVKGAIGFGLEVVFFDPGGKRRAAGATHRIRSLRELLPLLERMKDENGAPSSGAS